MLLNDVNKKYIEISTKKTKPTQENEDISNSGNEKQAPEKEIKSFNYKDTENNIIEYPHNIQRRDFYKNPIVKNGNQKVTFIDKITDKNFEEVIKIESFKDYNKTEEMKTKNVYNNCCFLV